MKLRPTAIAGAMLALFAPTAFAPAAFAQDSRKDQASRQKNKNTWRNGAIGAGALGVYGLLKGDKTATVLGAAGAAYSAKRYEDERKSQDQKKRARQDSAYYHRSGTSNGRQYYQYEGHRYYKDLKTGDRHRID